MLVVKQLFSSKVGIAGKSPAYGINLAQGTGVNNKIAWTDSTPNFAASIYASSSTDKLTFATKNSSNVETTALEIDISQNATFAGDVTTSLRLKSLGADTNTNVIASSSHGISLQNTSNTDGNFVPIDFFNSTGFCDRKNRC